MADYPEPRRGLVIHYDYKWYRQRDQDHGDKPRPCLIISARLDPDTGHTIARVLPITTVPQNDPSSALPVPPEIQKRLRLAQASWVRTDEQNKIRQWPDAENRRRIPRGPRAGEYVHGSVSEPFFRRVAASVNENIRRQRLQQTGREAADTNNPAYRQGRATGDPKKPG